MAAKAEHQKQKEVIVKGTTKISPPTNLQKFGIKKDLPKVNPMPSEQTETEQQTTSKENKQQVEEPSKVKVVDDESDQEMNEDKKVQEKKKSYVAGKKPQTSSQKRKQDSDKDIDTKDSQKQS